MWDERYDTETYVYGTRPNDFLAANADKIPKNGKVLSLAEGEGRNAVFLAEKGFDVLGVDGSRVGLEKAERLARERHVQITTETADLEGYTIAPGAFDGIVSIFCHLPPSIRRALYRQVVTGLKPGGLFLLEAYTPKQLEYRTGGPPTAELMVTLEILNRELGELERLHAVELVREVNEGTLHHGEGAVVQFIGQKPKTRQPLSGGV